MNIRKITLIILSGLITALTIFALIRYPGNGYVYILFSVLSNLLLYAGFRPNAIFFDAFLGVFFWLGFWLKFTIRILFSGGVFFEQVGYFDGSAISFDRALLVVSCGLAGFLLATFIREKLSYNYSKKMEDLELQGLFTFYKKYRIAILIGFVGLFVMVGVSNAYLGIYQRGGVTQTVLPFGLNGIYKWLLLFGLASISAMILRFEFVISKGSPLVVMLLSLLESFVSNVSLLSRGMILNSAALLYGTFAFLKIYSIKTKIRTFVATLLIFITLFVVSVYVVNYLRSSIYSDDASLAGAHSRTTPLVIDRWVGMEGVMAVSSYPRLGWDLWETAWKETYNENETSFYDNELIESSYANTDKSKHHFISLPGIIAFFFYPGSFLFLFFCMFALGGMAATIEMFVFRFGGRNIILCALLAQVIAFRYASFGYVPQQSYLLFGTLFLNVMIIYYANKAFSRFYKDVPAQ